MILHVDLNSFFARVEQQANPHLRNRPIGILGKGHKGARTCVCAASPEAKKFGVKSGMSVGEAQQLCPRITLVPPDYPKYLDISRRFMQVLEEFSPWVEIFSIDEAYVDLKFQIPNDKDQIKSKIQSFKNHHSLEIENYLGFGNCDLELIDAIDVALAIKQRLHEELGELITVSIGIAWGKIFAKLAGELQKPDGLTVLTPQTWLNQTGHLPITELCGIGYRIGNYLQSLNILSIRDLVSVDQTLLMAKFGRNTGIRLWEIGQGIDRSTVKASTLDLAPPKSIGHQITLDTDWRWDQLYPIFAKLTKKVGRRLRKSGQAAQSVTIHAVTNGTGYLVQTSRHQPAITHDHELLRSVHYLYQNSHSPQWQRIRKLGVVASNLHPSTDQPLPLFPREFQKAQITKSLDQLRDHYGEDSIEWGSAFGVEVGNLRDWRGPHAVLDR